MPFHRTGAGEDPEPEDLAPWRNWQKVRVFTVLIVRGEKVSDPRYQRVAGFIIRKMGINVS